MWYKSECWMTYCGLHVSPKSHDCFDDGTYYLGLSYDVDHNQVLIRCPYDRSTPCVFRESIFDNSVFGKPFSRYCVSEPVNCSYDYNQSAELIYTHEDQRFNRRMGEFFERYPHFRGCQRLTRNDQGKIVFDRFEYIRDHCTDCRNNVCGLTGKQRDLTMVNIVGDYEYVIMPDGLVERKIREIAHQISKRPITTDSAIRMMKSLELCDDSVFLNQLSMKKPTRMYLQKMHSRRSLVDDLKNAAEGIEVILSKDILRAKAKQKRDARNKRRNQKKSYPVRKIKRWAEEYLDADTEHDVRLNAKRNLIEYGVDIETIQKNYLSEIISF